MDANLLNRMEWSDAGFADGTEPTVTYRTALAVYEESLINGRRYFDDAGHYDTPGRGAYVRAASV